jgi:hypothetical protein
MTVSNSGDTFFRNGAVHRCDLLLVGEICAQLKDPGRNGGRNLTLLHEHLATDDLVAWGWNPGLGRDPAPGTQARLGELIKAWIDTRAQCPL